MPPPPPDRARGIKTDGTRAGGFNPLDVLKGASVTDFLPGKIGGDAGPSVSGGNPFAQGVLSAPFVVGEGATTGGGTPNLTLLVLIGAVAAVAIAGIRRL